ncbi:MIP/aquaporin family protein [Schumannella soli]|uniref:Aquaporin family protein n=1 Tax=Schumannella soli TaxID=2590779 RepID=A0A506Y769_9MICO|nr:MIP/aquaporin family protein [Schumannella soli]TPW77865.1 aquaporin family protein [Schumannella soli]
MDDNRTWQRLAAEFVGTAFLVFIGVGSVPAALILNKGEFDMASLGFVSLSFATIVIGTVYVFGYISGNHINPAVTIALAVTKKFPWRDVPGYLAAQVLGASLGALAIFGVLGPKAVDYGLGVAAYGGIPVWQAFIAEFVGTFVLVFTVFGVIHRKAAPGFAGMAIGLVVFAAIIPVAPATGASINPARTTGPMLILQILGGDVHWEQWPVYVLAELAAGIAAAGAFTLVSRTRADRSTLTEALVEKDERV